MLSRVVAWVLVVAWVVVSIGGVLQLSRESSYADLAAGVRAGEITSVTVVGDVPASVRGSGGVELQWREGAWRRHVVVVGSTLPSEVRAERSRVLPAPVADTLARRFEGLDVRPGEVSVTERGRWLGVLGGVALLCTVLLVITTPRPVRATRWAWFWLLGLVPPVGILAFLLIGGPTGLIPQREGGRTLTGGWAFLLAVLCGTAPTALWVAG